MTVHLKKLAVGCKTIDALYERQSVRIVDYHGQDAVGIWTRHKPKREGEALENGSLYWVVNGSIACRQTILGFERVEDAEEGTFCLIMVEAAIIRTLPEKHRPFQGWRYLPAEKAPADRGPFVPGEAEEQDIPAEMKEDLRQSGLL